MSFTPYNAPLLGSLLGDHEAAGFFSVKADIEAMLQFEICLAKAQAQLGMISKEASQEITQKLSIYEADIRTLSQAAAIDGMVVPQFIKSMREILSASSAPSLHFKSTSQDVIDTSAMMRMKHCAELLLTRVNRLIKSLETLKAKNANHTFMAYTRMQAALPSKAGERIDTWLNPLLHAKISFENLHFPLQLGGPIASSQAYDGQLFKIAELMAPELNLRVPSHVWHNDRSCLVEIGTWLSIVSGHLGKMGKDVCLMAQMGIDQIEISGGGSSSAMVHKQNPVLAETLVTIAQFNASQMTGLHQALNHEQERSGASWMLEWMIMPQLFVSTGAALRNAENMIQSIECIGVADA